MLPGANAMEVAKNVKKAMEEISENFPEGLSYEIPFDMTTYISESIHEVYKTLFEALVLVVLVVYLSLQSWRATLIDVYKRQILMFPSMLLIFYPAVFGIQNDEDSRILEILFGIPDYKYKVWGCLLYTSSSSRSA